MIRRCLVKQKRMLVDFNTNQPDDESRKRRWKLRGAKKYLYTANWPLGNRRVRCCLMFDIRSGKDREEKGRHIKTEWTLYIIYPCCSVTFLAVVNSCLCLAFRFSPPAKLQHTSLTRDQKACWSHAKLKHWWSSNSNNRDEELQANTEMKNTM